MNFEKKFIKKGYKLRKDLFEKFYLLKEGHPGSVFSILDVLITLYYGKYIRKKNNKIFDEIIMSKGHATVAQYPILNDIGIISKKDWGNWGRNKNTCLKMFGNHLIPGIKVATGSLGHGIGFATGIGMASKNKRVYPIISEGELYEGSTWEGLLLLGSLKLSNVNIILDVNNNIILGNPKHCLDLGNIEKKIKSFDIVVDRCDGHDYKIFNRKLTKLTKLKKPTCLIVDTVKGKGFSLMENKANWHYWNNISEEKFKNELVKLKRKYKY